MEEETGLFDDMMLPEGFSMNTVQKKSGLPEKKDDSNLYLKTEMAFTFIKEHETVEKKYAEGRLDLGTATTERDVRV